MNFNDAAAILYNTLPCFILTLEQDEDDDWIGEIECAATGNRAYVIVPGGGFANPIVEWPA